MPDHTLHNDTEIFARMADGDELAFNTIFHLYHKRFYAAAVKMTRSQQIAEELVQDVFIALWQRRAEMKEMEKPFSYLFTILYNSIYKHLKQIAEEKRRLATLQQETSETGDPFEDLLLDKENQKILHRAVDQLPEQQKKVYILIKQQGHSREEAAKILGLSPNTVRNHLAEAVNGLRSYLQRALPLLVYVMFLKNN